MQDDHEQLLQEINAWITLLTDRIGFEARRAAAAFPAGRDPAGRALFVPRVALLATLCEHPGVEQPTRAQVDDWERRYAAYVDATADDTIEREGARIGRRIVSATFDSFRARLR